MKMEALLTFSKHKLGLFIALLFLATGASPAVEAGSVFKKIGSYYEESEPGICSGATCTSTFNLLDTANNLVVSSASCSLQVTGGGFYSLMRAELTENPANTSVFLQTNYNGQDSTNAFNLSASTTGIHLISGGSKPVIYLDLNNATFKLKALRCTIGGTIVRG